MWNRPSNQYAPSGLRPAGKMADRSLSDRPNTRPPAAVTRSATVSASIRSGLPACFGVFRLASPLASATAFAGAGAGTNW